MLYLIRRRTNIIHVYNYHYSIFQLSIIFLIKNGHAEPTEACMEESSLLFPDISLSVDNTCNKKQ